MKHLSQVEAEELRDAVAGSLIQWLEAELPVQIEQRVGAVLEEMLDPGFARSLRANLDRALRPAIRREVEQQIRSELSGTLAEIRTQVIAQEKELTRSILRATILEELRNEVRQELLSNLGSILQSLPNKSLEPTATAVTPRADARVAPAVAVAHH